MNIPANHVLFIPLGIAVGFLLGYWAGVRRTQKDWSRAEAARLQAMYAAGSVRGSEADEASPTGRGPD